jgi:hypothetical protein
MDTNINMMVSLPYVPLHKKKITDGGRVTRKLASILRIFLHKQNVLRLSFSQVQYCYSIARLVGTMKQLYLFIDNVSDHIILTYNI